MRAARRALVAAPVVLGGVQAAPLIGWTTPGRIVFPALCRFDAFDPVDAVALTFDDGPDRHLEAFLRVLGDAGARATFFVIGEQVERSPSLVRDALAEGHEVGIHGYRHRCHLRLTPSQAREDLRRARGVVEDVAGCGVAHFRPPYGTFSLGSWVEAGRQGWRRVLWSRWGRDWEARATPRSVAARIGTPEPGDILLLHDADRYSSPGSWRTTLEALPLILEQCMEAGLVPRTVGELCRRAQPR